MPICKKQKCENESEYVVERIENFRYNFDTKKLMFLVKWLNVRLFWILTRKDFF